MLLSSSSNNCKCLEISPFGLLLRSIMWFVKRTCVTESGQNMTFSDGSMLG